MRSTGCSLFLCFVSLCIPQLSGCNETTSGSIENADQRGDEVQKKTTADEKKNLVSLTHDFGIVEPDTVMAHTFDVKNESDQAWKIVGKIVPCACSQVVISKNTIAPDDSVAVSVEIKSGTSNRDLLIPITINLSDQQTIQLNCRALIRKLISLNVNTLTFNESDKGQVEREVIVRNYSGVRWESLSVEPANQALSFKTGRLVADAQGGPDKPLETWYIKAASTPSLFTQSEKSLSFTIQATGIDGSKSQDSLYCILRHEYPLRVIPDKVFVIGNRTEKEPVIKNVIITSNTRIDDSQFSVTDTADFIEVKEIVRLTPYKRKVRFKILAGKALPGTNKSTVNLTYRNRKVELPVSVYINDSSG